VAVLNLKLHCKLVGLSLYCSHFYTIQWKEISDSFKVSAGVRQCFILAPDLFLEPTDWIVSRSVYRVLSVSFWQETFRLLSSVLLTMLLSAAHPSHTSDVIRGSRLKPGIPHENKPTIYDITHPRPSAQDVWPFLPS